MVEPDRPQITNITGSMRIDCWITKATDKHTLRNTYCSSAATMITRTRPIVTLYVRCLSFSVLGVYEHNSNTNITMTSMTTMATTTIIRFNNHEDNDDDIDNDDNNNNNNNNQNNNWWNEKVLIIKYIYDAGYSSMWYRGWFLFFFRCWTSFNWRYWPSQRRPSTLLYPGHRLTNFLSSFDQGPLWYCLPICIWVFLLVSWLRDSI